MENTKIATSVKVYIDLEFSKAIFQLLRE